MDFESGLDDVTVALWLLSIWTSIVVALVVACFIFI